MRDRLVDGFVSVLELDVFTDDADGYFVFGREDAADDLLPDVFNRWGIFEPEEIDHELIHALFLQRQRELVDRAVDIHALDDGLHGHVAEHRNLVAQIVIERVIGAAHEHVGLDADLAELGDGLLRGLGLEFAGGLEERYERDVDEHAIRRADLEGKLAHRFEKRQAFDVAGGAADFGDEDVDVFAAGINALLDLVGHVRDHLHGFAKVITAAFLLNDRFVNLAGAETIKTGKFSAGKTFVMAEVEVGLGAVFEDVHFAVLERAHGAWIDIEVGVELLDTHRQAAQF